MRTRKTLPALSALLALDLLSPVLAQEARPAADPVLAQLPGDYQGRLTFEADGQRSPVQARLSCRRAAGGAAVACTLSARGIPGVALFEESDLWGRDAATGRYHLYAVTNSGDVHDHAGAYAGDTLSLELRTTVEGQPFLEQISIRFQGREGFQLSDTTSVGGRVVASLTGAFRR